MSPIFIDTGRFIFCLEDRGVPSSRLVISSEDASVAGIGRELGLSDRWYRRWRLYVILKQARAVRVVNRQSCFPSLALCWFDIRDILLLDRTPNRIIDPAAPLRVSQ